MHVSKVDEVRESSQGNSFLLVSGKERAGR